MNIDGIPTRTLRARAEQRTINIIDQTRLPPALPCCGRRVRRP
jgi:methylthioribose-1-phosphate isomerase